MKLQAGDILFLDTNILLTATDASRTHCDHARMIFQSAVRAGLHLTISGQIIREYLVVATRTLEVNGLGLSREEALFNIGEFRRRAVVLDETEEVSEKLIEIVSALPITGKHIHDANVAATMIVHAVPLLVTENEADYKLFESIETVGPEQLLRHLPEE